MNLMSHKKRLSDIQLAIPGNGKTIYYCISTFHKLLLMVFSEDQVKELFAVAHPQSSGFVLFDAADF